MQKKNKKKQYIQAKNIGLRLIFCLIFVSILLGTYFFKMQIEAFVQGWVFPEISADVEQSVLRVHYINVGNADCIAIELPDDKHMIIDSGDNTSASENAMLSYLNETFFTSSEEKTFDYFVLTHTDSDHSGGADKIFANFQVNAVYRPAVFTQAEADEQGVTNDKKICKTSVYESFVAGIRAEVGCVENFSNEDSDIVGANYTIDFLAPLQDVYSMPNNYSAVIVLSYAGKKFMFTGDAEKAVEDELIQAYSQEILNVDVLKVGHHGATTSSQTIFLNALSPTYAIICTGENSYGHPKSETLERLENAGVKANCLFRTDLNGNIVMGVSAQGVIAVALGQYSHTGVNVEWWQMVVSTSMLGCTIILCFNLKTAKKLVKKKTTKMSKIAD